MSKYLPIITKLFESNKRFVPEDFYEFVAEVTKKYPNNRNTLPPNIDQDGNKYIREDICEYTDNNGDKMAIMIYKMPSKTKVERARSEQRNLISTYLKNIGVFNWVNSVLVAFYSDAIDSHDWRLSFVKQEFKLSETELDAKWRPKIVNELTPAKRFSFLVEFNSKNLTVKQRLADLISERVLIVDIEKAFSVEKVSKDFFEKYVKLYERLSKAFKKVEEEKNNGDEHFRENFVKKLLGQIVFLYFLQKKWWLWVKKDEKWWDGDKNFLQNLFQECVQWGDLKKESGWKNYFNDYLEHLFYDNLNLKREGDYSEYFECRIPYLNGWLFEPINGYDWKNSSNILLAWDENNSIFRDIFETFDEYNFTVYENDPLEQDVAVDPEMLGKVFENLLPENERKGKWAFYTPREIVHYMCKESLKNYIINKTGISEERIAILLEKKDSMYNLTEFWKNISRVERIIQYWSFLEDAKKIIDALVTVKIVDPAVGSGAFPMWLLKEIVSLRKYLQENILLEENVSEYTIKKETLENCIYGVDLDPWAVEIAKLRFWLSLVIEEESKESIDPLPNLDYKIIQWNSLIEDIVVWETVIKLDIEWNSKKLTKKQTKEIGNASQIGLWFFADETEQEDTLKKLKFLHKRFFQEKDNVNKKKLKEEIDLVEKELIRISGELEVNKLKTKIESIEWKYLLSGTSPDTKDAKDIERLSSQIQEIKDMEEKYKRDNVRTFFPWKLHFAEVINENWGFDIVIGNPPYVRQEEITQFKEYFKIAFKDFFHWRSDLYTYFYKKGHELLKDKW
jgi:adenine-specific DNA-methyltransferase